jgi:quinol monooxygenase YgiN
MLVVRFKVKAQPQHGDKLANQFAKVVHASRPLKGVIGFDIGRDIVDRNSFIATEVFEDREALDRQEALQEVKDTVEMLGEVLAAPPDAMVYDIKSATPWE